MADRTPKRARTQPEASDEAKSSPSAPNSVEAAKRALRAEQERRLKEKVGSIQKKGPAAQTKARATPKTVRAPAYTNFILDCDGVIWHGNDPIPGSVEAILALRARGFGIHFVTNSSASSRNGLAAKLRSIGLTFVNETMVTTSGSAAAQLIKSKFPDVTHVYAVGETGLMEELAIANLHPSGGPEDNTLTAQNDVEFRNINIDPMVQLVVCGLDRMFNYGKLVRASRYLQQGCKFVCTNLDAYDVLPPYGRVPGAGCIIAALTTSYPVEPLVAGKPSGEMLREIMRQRGFEESKTIMIGDRVDTDIQCAHNAGIASCLVLSGVASELHRELAKYCFLDLAKFVESQLTES